MIPALKSYNFVNTQKSTATPESTCCYSARPVVTNSDTVALVYLIPRLAITSFSISTPTSYSYESFLIIMGGTLEGSFTIGAE
jgi:hypothetical protein